MSYQTNTENDRQIVHVERQGNVKYTYYDDGVVKITRYKAKRKVYWGRIFAVLIVFVLIVMGLVQLIRVTANVLNGGSTDSQETKSFIFDSSQADESSVQDEEVTVSDSADTSTESQIEEETQLQASYSQMSFKVCLDAGHGDYDTGATYGDLTESDQNLEMAQLVCDYLEQCGVTVVMTRDEDEAVSNSDRCTLANQESADFFISIHRNSTDDDSEQSNGVEAWVNNNQPVYDTALAQSILNALESVGVSQNLGVKYGYSGMTDQNYQVNTDTVMPSCLLQLGYITSDTDNELYNTYKEQYAKAIGDAIIQTAINLGVVDESGTRVLNEQLISDGKSTAVLN
ncbi:MAG: N-acetylmuramoyl-L-alanine amidase [Ruminococcus sp.]|nr:N-acetylmuramoyl-L-alanine amidase [Ruminococcus sp.]